jgi:hypothetical protein
MLLLVEQIFTEQLAASMFNKEAGRKFLQVKRQAAKAASTFVSFMELGLINLQTKSNLQKKMHKTN